MNDRQRFLQRLSQRLKRKTPRRRALAARHRRIWCEVLEPRLALAAPVAVNDGYSALENVVPLNVSAPGVLANDRDADGDLLSAMIVAGPARGTLSLGTNGAFAYTPYANFFQGDSFTYRVSDGALQSNPATVFLSVDCDCNPPIGPMPINFAPVAVNDAYNSQEDVVLNVPAATGVLANDTDPDLPAPTLTASIVNPSPAATGTVTMASNGSFVFTPALNFYGSTSFTYRASDGSLSSNVATVAITVAAVNDAPIAVNDTYTVSEDTQLQVPAINGVLRNDTDVDVGATLTAQLAGQPAHGAVTLNANGSFAYTPQINFNGVDSFTYRANDGTLSSNLATVTIVVSPCNSPPYAANDGYSLNEDTVLTIVAPGVLANDGLDCSHGPLSVAGVAIGPAHGTLLLNPNGGFSYTPFANFFGTDSFTYRASDGMLSTNDARVTLNVQPVNDAPVAANNFYTVMEDTPLAVNPAQGVLANDTDVEGDVISAQLGASTLHGTLSLNLNGGFVYTPFINFSGVDSFTYRASDGALNSQPATVTINVMTCGSCVPLAINDSYTAVRNTALNIAAPGVLANDMDAEGNSLTAILVAAPASGTLTLNANGSFRYTPNNNFTGPDSFTYRNSDGQIQSNVATATITVQSANNPPIAHPDSFTATEDTPLSVPAPGVLNNDTDVDGNPLFAVLVSGPARGTLSLNANGGFVYTPALNYFGPDSFRYCANDGQFDSNTATVTITVANIPDPPIAFNDNYSASRGSPLSINIPGVLANDIDIDGDALTASLVAGPAQGTVALNSTGSFTYTPANCFTGLVSFTYRVSDGSFFSNAATVSINIGGLGAPPAGAVNDSFTVNEDTTLNVSAPGVLINDGDSCYPALIAQLVTAPARGTLSLNINGSFTYTPNANYYGPDSFTYRVSEGLLPGLLLSNLATVTIAVMPINDAPVAQPDSFTVHSGAAVTIAAPGVLTNDFDVEGDPLTAILVASPLPAHGPLHGTVVLNANGSFTYTPNVGFAGLDSFTYGTNDGALQSGLAVVTLRVNVTNLPPVAAGDAYSTNEDVPLVVTSPGVLANDTDVNGDTLADQLVTLPANGTLSLNANGGFAYIPSADFHGVDSFTYRASDGQLASNPATVTINVQPVNDPPVATNDTYNATENTVLNIAAPGVLGNDSDRDSTGLTVSLFIVTAPTRGTLILNPNGSFTYTPSANFSGLDSFSYRASDGQLTSNAATVLLNVIGCQSCFPLAINDAYTIAQNSNLPLTVAAPGVLANDIDSNGDALTALVVAHPAHGAVLLNTNGSFVYAPQAGFAGVDSFTYRASDGVATSNVATVSINVTQPQNSPPLSVNDSYSVQRDGTLTIAAPGILANDSDVDGDPLTAVLVATPHVGTLSLSPGGAFTFTPPAAFTGPASFTYRAADGIQLGNQATVHLNVSGANVPPVAASDTFAVNANQLLTIGAPGVLANDVDANGDALLAVLVALPAHGTLSLGSSGAFTYLPNQNFHGVDTFTYLARDGQSNSNVATVTLHVVPHCLAPTCPGDIGDDQYALLEDVPLVIGVPGVLANDGDFEDLPVSAVLVAGPARGTLSFNSNGSFLYTPQPNFNGVDSFTYRAYDGQAYSNVARVTLTVTPVNDPPVALPDVYTLSICGIGTIGSPGVLGNDIDVDGNTLTAVLVSGPAQGTLTLNANGGFTYTAAANFAGHDSFSYRASDGSASSAPAAVILNISAAAEVPPVAFNDSYTATKNTPLIVGAPGVLANDNDDCGAERLTAHLVTGPANGSLTLEPSGRFQYIPSPGFGGTDSFTYRASDRHLTSNIATVSLTFATTNDQPPIAVSDRYTTARNIQLSISGLGVLGNDLDPEGRPLTAALVAGPANGTLSLQPAGGFTYMPAQNFTGVDSFTYRASDGILNSGVATVTIAVAAPGENTSPVANHDQFYAIEDLAVSVFPGVLANDTDAERNALTAALVEGPAHGTLSLSAAGSFYYQPEGNFHGLDRFTYRASDGSLTSDIATVSIFVFNINDPPVAANDTYSGLANTPLVISPLGILANDVDIDGDTLTVSVVLSPFTHGSWALSGNGGFTYVPNQGYTGPDSLTYRASDGALTSNIATVSINVRSENVPPSFVKGADQTTTDEAGPQTIENWATQIATGPSGEANQTLTFLVTATTSHLFAVPPHVTPAGRLTYTPALMASGTAVVTVRLQDSGSGENTSPPQTFTVAIARLHASHNVRNPLDTNADGFVSPIDAVLVINLLNSSGSGPVAALLSGSELLYPDVSGDDFVSPIDAVLVINALNSRAVAAPLAEGESTPVPAASDLSNPSTTAAADDDSLASLLTLLAPDIAQSTRRRRSR